MSNLHTFSDVIDDIEQNPNPQDESPEEPSNLQEKSFQSRKRDSPSGVKEAFSEEEEDEEETQTSPKKKRRTPEHLEEEKEEEKPLARRRRARRSTRSREMEYNEMTRDSMLVELSDAATVEELILMLQDKFIPMIQRLSNKKGGSSMEEEEEEDEEDEEEEDEEEEEEERNSNSRDKFLSDQEQAKQDLRKLLKSNKIKALNPKPKKPTGFVKMKREKEKELNNEGLKMGFDSFDKITDWSKKKLKEWENSVIQNIPKDMIDTFRQFSLYLVDTNGYNDDDPKFFDNYIQYLRAIFRTLPNKDVYAETNLANDLAQTFSGKNAMEALMEVLYEREVHSKFDEELEILNGRYNKRKEHVGEDVLNEIHELDHELGDMEEEMDEIKQKLADMEMDSVPRSSEQYKEKARIKRDKSKKLDNHKKKMKQLLKQEDEDGGKKYREEFEEAMFLMSEMEEQLNNVRGIVRRAFKENPTKSITHEELVQKLRPELSPLLKYNHNVSVGKWIPEKYRANHEELDQKFDESSDEEFEPSEGEDSSDDEFSINEDEDEDEDDEALEELVDEDEYEEV